MQKSTSLGLLAIVAQFLAMVLVTMADEEAYNERIDDNLRFAATVGRRLNGIGEGSSTRPDSGVANPQRIRFSSLYGKRRG